MSVKANDGPKSPTRNFRRAPANHAIKREYQRRTRRNPQIVVTTDYTDSTNSILSSSVLSVQSVVESVG
jgi:hypothetical protein